MTARKLYVGVKGSTRKVFISVVKPTEATHGHLYGYVLGPFKTLRGADWYAAHPHQQLTHVNEMEKAAKRDAAAPSIYLGDLTGPQYDWYMRYAPWFNAHGKKKPKRSNPDDGYPDPWERAQAKAAARKVTKRLTKEQKAAVAAYENCLRQEDRYGMSVFVTPIGMRDKEAKTAEAYERCKRLGVERFC